MNPTNLFFFAAAALANLFLTPLFMRLANRWGWVDRPGHRKIHDKTTPKSGGLALFFSILVAVALGISLFGDVLNLDRASELRIALVLGFTFLVGLLGLLDDRYDLKPRHKLMGQAILFGLFVLIGSRFEVLHLPGLAPFSLSLLSYPLTLLWIMAVVNGFNFMDGMDGLAGSVTLVILTGMGAASLIIHGLYQTGMIWASALGAVSAFLVFNWRPAKVYLGDAGSNALGALVALSLVSLGRGQTALSSHDEPYRFQFIVATLLAGYPLLEVSLSTLRRGFKRFVLSRSIESSEQEHLHHQLMKLGRGAGTICALAMTFQVILAGAGLLVMVKQNALATWFLAPFFMALAFAGPRIGFLDFMKLRQVKEKPHYMIANYFISIQRAKMGLAHNREEILALVSQTCREFGVRCYRFKIKPDKAGKGGVDYLYQNEDMEWARSEGRPGLQNPEVQTGEFFEYCELPGHRGDAFWIFDSHTSQDELDMEYRVLLHGFMRDALEAAIATGEGEESLEVHPQTKLPHHRTSGHSLRKRNRTRSN